MSEAEQREQQPQPSTSKMTTLEAMAAKKEELEAKMEEMNRLVREHARLMELEQERILKEQEDAVRVRFVTTFCDVVSFRNKPLCNCTDSTTVCFCQPLGSNEETE